MKTEAQGAPIQLMPWKDRGDAAVPRVSPRSARDLELLRGLARRISAHDAGAQNNLGVVYYNKGLYAEAAAHFERALELDPHMQVAERNLHIAYFNTGFYHELVADLQARLRLDPGDTEALDQLARAYYNANDVPNAVTALRHWSFPPPSDGSASLDFDIQVTD